MLYGALSGKSRVLVGPGGAIRTERRGHIGGQRRTPGTARAKNPVTIELAGFLLAPVPADPVDVGRRAGGRPRPVEHVPPGALRPRALAIAEALLVTGLGLACRLSVADLACLEWAVLVLGLMRLLRRGRLAVVGRALIGALHALSARSTGERWLLAMAAAVLVLLFVHEIGLPTNDCDSLAYPWSGTTVGTSSTGPIGAGWINSYPFAWNALFFVAMAPVHGDQWALAPNLVTWLIIGLAVIGLARDAGGNRSSALAAAVVALLLPVNLHRRLSSLALDGEATAADMICYVSAQPVDVVAVGPRNGSSAVWDWLGRAPGGVRAGPRRWRGRGDRRLPGRPRRVVSRAARVRTGSCADARTR